MGKGIVKLGEGQWATKDGKLLAAKETNSRFKNTEFTVARGTRATYVGRDGLIANETGNDTPRIDFTGNTDGHLLLEPESRNLVTYSEDFSQSNWTENDAQILSSTHVNPDGSNNAKVLAYDGGTVQHYVSTTPSVDSGQNYTFSVFVKAKELNYVCLVFLNDLSGKFFNLENGTRLGNFGSEPFDSKIEDYGNGWYRCSITDSATSTTKFCGIYLSDNGTSINSTPTTTNGVYIWGAQLEKLSYPTSYIPTNGSQVTRDAETCTGAGEAADFNSEEGVLYAEIENTTGTEATYKMINITDSSETNRIGLFVYQNQISAESTGSGTNLGIYNKALQSGFNKIALKYKENDCALWVNGIEYTDTSFAAFSSNTLNTLVFEKGNGEFNFYGKCKAIRVYKETDGIDLATLTS
jgi:hypothetical protein